MKNENVPYSLLEGLDGKTIMEMFNGDCIIHMEDGMCRSVCYEDEPDDDYYFDPDEIEDDDDYIPHDNESDEIHDILMESWF